MSGDQHKAEYYKMPPDELQEEHEKVSKDIMSLVKNGIKYCRLDVSERDHFLTFQTKE